jgi:hypothetical protein
MVKQHIEGATLLATKMGQEEAPTIQHITLSHVQYARSRPTLSIDKKASNQYIVAPPRITQSQQTMRVEEESTTTRKVTS